MDDDTPEALQAAWTCSPPHTQRLVDARTHNRTCTRARARARSTARDPSPGQTEPTVPPPPPPALCPLLLPRTRAQQETPRSPRRCGGSTGPPAALARDARLVADSRLRRRRRPAALSEERRATPVSSPAVRAKQRDTAARVTGMSSRTTSHVKTRKLLFATIIIKDLLLLKIIIKEPLRQLRPVLYLEGEREGRQDSERVQSEMSRDERARASVKFEQIPVFCPHGCAAPLRGIAPIATLERFAVCCSCKQIMIVHHDLTASALVLSGSWRFQ